MNLENLENFESVSQKEIIFIFGGQSKKKKKKKEKKHPMDDSTKNDVTSDTTDTLKYDHRIK